MKIRANRNMSEFQVRMMARLRATSPDLADALGWDSSRNNCFRCADFERGLLKDASVVASHSYGPGRGIAAISLPEDGRFVVATIGLDPVVGDEGLDAGRVPELGLEVWDSNWYTASFDDAAPAGDADGDGVPFGVIFQIVVEELGIEPESPSELIDVLMGGSAHSPGGDFLIHETLIPDALPHFPELIVYSHDDFRLLPKPETAYAEVQRGMAKISLMAGSGSRSLSRGTRVVLAATLSKVGELVPFSGFTRSAFDMDPRSIFMALYRSLENLYSYAEVSALVKSLGIGMSWVEAAEHLSVKLKWRPKEEDALRKILLLASPDAPLERLIDALPGDGKVDESSNIPKLAASRLYAVRNAVVHHRPGMRGIDASITDWNEVIIHLAACLLAADTAVESGKMLSA